MAIRFAIVLCFATLCSSVALALEASEVLARWKETIAANTKAFLSEHEESEELRYENSQRKTRLLRIHTLYAVKEGSQFMQRTESYFAEGEAGEGESYRSRTYSLKNPDKFLSLSHESFDAPPTSVRYTSRPDDRHIEAKFAPARRPSEFAYTDHVPVWKILEEADHLVLRDKMEKVNEVACYVLEAKTTHGVYTVWLDPECGYLWRRATVHKEGDDLQWEKPMSANKSTDDTPEMPFPMTGVAFYDLEIRDVVIEKRDGHFVIVGATEAGVQTHITGEIVRETKKTKLLNIDFSPDFAALGTFDVKVPDGMSVRNDDDRDLKNKYVWKNGGPVLATQ